jgi:hypothetical protein
MRLQAGQWIIYYACTLHLLWGVLLLFGASPLMSLPLSVMAAWPVPAAAAAMFVVSGAALLALLREREMGGVGVWLCLPQQFLLTTCAIRALTAVSQGQYADGTVRDPLFILADQGPVILTALFHTFALVERYMLIGRWPPKS